LNDIGALLARHLDHQLEHIIQILVKASASTKKVLAAAAANAAQTFLRNSHFHFKTFVVVAHVMNDKNPALRNHIVNFLKHIIEGQLMCSAEFSDMQRHEKRTIFFQLGGWEVLEKALKKGVQDANPAVRESSRQIVWQLSDMWGEETIKRYIML
jgi:hypothetical protein